MFSAQHRLSEIPLEGTLLIEELLKGLRQSFERMICSYGLRRISSPSAITIERAPNFAGRAQNWLRPMNHNHLRLTRILRSTLILGLESESKALFQALNAIYREFPDRIPARTHAFWSSAAGS